jgi:hypothetical protein
MNQIPNLFTIRQFSERHPAFPEGALRWHVFRASTNGLGKLGAIKRIGRRVYLDETAFFTWINSQQGA